MKPGDLGMFDQVYMEGHAPKVRRLLQNWFGHSIEGLELLPDSPFLGVGNHSGGVMIPDTIAWLAEYNNTCPKYPLLTLAHPAIFATYPKRLTHYLARLGAIRADPRLALQALRTGQSVQVYPGGDNDACRSFRQRNQIVFANRKAYVKLAKKAGVPIVPIVSIGGHEVFCVLWDGVPLAKFFRLDRRFGLHAFPLSLCLPWGIWLGPQPGFLPLPVKISLKVLQPIQPEGSVDDIDFHVRNVMQSALDQMAQARGFLGIKQRLEQIL